MIDKSEVKSFDVLVIGGGAAGMVAAIAAARRGRRTAILESNSQLGKKLLITGKGRCNLTNNCTNEVFRENVVRNSSFLHSAIAAFSPQDTMSFFEALGVPLKTERSNRVFPVSDDSHDIRRALSDEINRLDIEVFYEHRVAKLVKNENGFVCLFDDASSLKAEHVILATGGKSYPQTGSTGDGYRLATSLGHTVTPIAPSLVSLNIGDKACRTMMGLTLKNIRLTLIAPDGSTAFSEIGELLFTHFGISGPLVLSASAHIPIGKDSEYSVSLDLKPGLTDQQLDARLLRDFSDSQNRDFCNALAKLLPQKLISAIIFRSAIPHHQKVNSITTAQRAELRRILKDFRLPVTSRRPIEEAVITAGGVEVREISPKTMESRLVPGLFFAGELIDVDAYTGGFNLQIAFSTAFLAGSNA